MYRLLWIAPLAGVLFGCSSRVPAAAPAAADVLYVVAQSSSRESLAVTVALPIAACRPPEHGALVIDGAWTSDRNVEGLRAGTASLRWPTMRPLVLDLQPMPADVAVQFVATRDFDVPRGRWVGWWIERSEGVPDTVGTVDIRRLDDGADCSR